MMKIITSPWDQEFKRFVCLARVSLRVAAPYYGLWVIESIMEKSGPKFRKSFLLEPSDAGVRAGSKKRGRVTTTESSCAPRPKRASVGQEKRGGAVWACRLGRISSKNPYQAVTEN
jgi:hypothetical protein